MYDKQYISFTGFQNRRTRVEPAKQKNSDRHKKNSTCESRKNNFKNNKNNKNKNKNKP